MIADSNLFQRFVISKALFVYFSNGIGMFADLYLRWNDNLCQMAGMLHSHIDHERAIVWMFIGKDRSPDTR